MQTRRGTRRTGRLVALKYNWGGRPDSLLLSPRLPALLCGSPLWCDPATPVCLTFIIPAPWSWFSNTCLSFSCSRTFSSPGRPLLLFPRMCQLTEERLPPVWGFSGFQGDGDVLAGLILWTGSGCLPLRVSSPVTQNKRVKEHILILKNVNKTKYRKSWFRSGGDHWLAGPRLSLLYFCCWLNSFQNMASRFPCRLVIETWLSPVRFSGWQFMMVSGPCTLHVLELSLIPRVYSVHLCPLPRPNCMQFKVRRYQWISSVWLSVSLTFSPR